MLIISYSILRNSFHAMMLRVGMRSVTTGISHVILTYHYFQISRTKLTFLPVFLQVALCYKPEGRGFDSRWCHWNFSLTKSFRPHYGPVVDSASNRNEYQEYFLGVKAAGA